MQCDERCRLPVQWAGTRASRQRVQSEWIAAALSVAVLPSQLWFVLHPENEAGR